MVSRYLTGQQAERLFNAASFCIAGYGETFDVHLVFAWAYAGLADHKAASERFVQVKNRIQKRLARRHGMEAHFIYTHENSRSHGFHTHMLLHAGSAWRDLEAWLPSDVAAVCGTALPGNMLHMAHRRQRQRLNRTTLHWLWTGYLLKGIHPELKVRDFVDKRHLKPVREVLRLRTRDAGIVACRKRAGVSATLGEAAQAKVGYRSPFMMGWDSWLYSDEEYQIFRDRLARQDADKRTIDSLSFLLDG